MSVSISGTSGLTFPDTTTLPSAIHSNIYPLTVTASAGALTATLSPCAIDFRSATLTTGTNTTLAVGSAITVTAASGATLGSTSGSATNVIIIAINNAGTVELALVQQGVGTTAQTASGGFTLDETGVISTTAISAAATSANVFYSTNARTNVAYRVVGYATAVNTTGAWAAPTLVQGYGGQSMVAFESLGYNQNYYIVSATVGTTYYNTSGRPIMVSFYVSGSPPTATTLTINGNGVDYISVNTSAGYCMKGIVPAGGNWVVAGAIGASSPTGTAGAVTILK